MSKFLRDEPWVLPSAFLTLVSATVALGMIDTGVWAVMGFLPLWIMAVAATALLAIFGFVLKMMMTGVQSPTARIIDYARADRNRLAFVAAAMLFAGLNMTAFMLAKPLLNYLVPFWADPLLADADAALLGEGFWRSLEWLNTKFTAIFYHRAWFAMIIATLLLVLFQPPSPRKSAAMLSYFLLWSVVGPVMHSLLPAAGPIFYDRLGYGDRYAALTAGPDVTQAADYLWRFYSAQNYGAAAGISAMPSLHIATVVWMALAVGMFARLWTVPVAAIGFVIFLLSISLGWHYAVDGLVGGLLALLAFGVCLPMFQGVPITAKLQSGNAT